ncbi:MAG: hypothetical protein D6795_12570 [Deltaproteobacteria bacterium]|nr:MAG: hypothetical protein D6795_12570 [Deltaproteobacteria bacterium]
MKGFLKKTCRFQIFATIAVVSALGIVSGCTSEDDPALFLFEQGDAYRGGALWDTWWKVPDVKEGIEPGFPGNPDEDLPPSSLPADNPLYATNPQGNTRSGSQTWRCKECHGWDYKGADGAYGSGSHATGFPGVLAARDRSVPELVAAIRDGEGIGEGHAFGTVLSDQDVIDLVKFIREGTIDADVVVNAAGDPDRGKERFADSCSTCHGEDGKKINFKMGSYDSEYLFNIAIENPYEFIHKVRFGQPNGEMPNGAVKGYVLSDVADILTYTKTLAPEGLEEASAIRGGALWDNWWKINGASAPENTNPLYEDPTYNTLGGAKSGSDTWRCKECHGWDYKGVDGAYGSGSHATGIKGVFGAAEMAPADLIAIIGEGKFPDGRTLEGHHFQQEGLLSAKDVEDLALFIREELVDDALYISMVTHRSKGSPVLGEALFDTNCKTCHGDDGMHVNFKHDDPGETEYVGDVARDNPFELTHKVRFGQPGSDEEATELEEDFGIITGHMPNKFDAGYTENDVANIVAYAQHLPGTVERGGIAWDKWWEASDVAEPIEPGGSITLEDGTVVESSLPADNPLYLTNPLGNERRGSQTWRCKECHGWDGKGVDGAYGSGSHATGFPGVFQAKGKDPQELHDAIAKGIVDGRTVENHAFADLLGENVIRDLVNYIRHIPDYTRELIDADTKGVKIPYDPDTMQERTRDANFTLGQIKFQDNCARCHGSDGRAINFEEGEGEEEYVGDVARDNPWELLHKVIHGQPGSEPRMTNAAGEGYTTDDLADLLYYVQQLP